MTSDAGRVSVESGVVVGKAGDRELKADVYRPPNQQPGAPAVLLIHGGGWRSGDRTQLKGLGILIGREGYVCVACEYRLTPEAPWPAQIHDVKAVLRWMRANADGLGIDPDQIAVEGNSAGAHLALFMAATADDPAWEGESGTPGVSTAVAAAIGVYTPTLFGDAFDNPRGSVPAEALLPNAATPDAAKAASPLSYVRPDFPPTLLLHGNDDLLVPESASLVLYEALRKANVPVELHVYAEQPHAFDADPAFGRQSAAIMTLFLDRYVSARRPKRAQVDPSLTGETVQAAG